MPATPLRARTAFEVIDAAVHVLRAHYGSFVVISAIASFPTWTAMWFSGWYTLAANPENIGRLGTLPLFQAQMLLVLLATYLWWTIADCAIVVAASDAYLGRDVVPARALGVALRNAFPILGARILKGFALILGYLFFFFGALYMAARYFAVVPALLLDGTPVMDSFHRSRDLSKDFKWHILGGLFVGWVIYFVVAYTLGVVAALFVTSPIVSAVVTAAVYALVFPLIGIVTTLLYYDQRIRKEGFDLEVMAQQLVPAAG